jgi:hypothetical protein
MRLLDPETVLATPRLAATGCFGAMRVIETAEGEDAAANAIAVNGRVFLSAGHPGTAERLSEAGFPGGGASHNAGRPRRWGAQLHVAALQPEGGVMIRWLLDGPLKGFPDLPPVWLMGFMAAAWAIDRGLPLVEAFGPVYRVAGGLLMLAALGLIAWSALWFWRKKTTIEPHHTPTALIVEGPYRLSRNPIYLALLVSGGLRAAAGVSRPRDPSLRLLHGSSPAASSSRRRRA